MDDPILEERLKKMFESRAGELPDESLREVRIRKRVYEQIEREETHMKRGFMKKAVIAVAAICVFGSMTAFAIGNIAGVTSHSDRRDEVHTYEQALKLQEEHGPKVNFPKQFSNGYTFESAVPVNYETSDKDGNKLGKGSRHYLRKRGDGTDHIFCGSRSGRRERSDGCKDVRGWHGTSIL